MRTFVAIELADSMRNSLARVQAELGPHLPGVSWVRADSLHLTLKFLGEVRKADLPRACELIRESAASAPVFEARLSGLGVFPDLRRPRVVWVGVRDDPPALAELHARLDEGLAEIGAPRENRAFRPHLTLGRVRRPGSAAGLGEPIERFSKSDLGEMTVDEIVFMQSELTPSGAVYTPLARFACGGAG